MSEICNSEEVAVAEM